MDSQENKILCSAALSSTDNRALFSLIHACRNQDGRLPSYPSSPGEAKAHYLLWQDPSPGAGRLLSALAILPDGPGTLECIALTHPDHRKEGHFSQLLSHMLKTHGDYDILFPVSGICPDTQAALYAIGAELDHVELLMEARTACLPPLPISEDRLVPQPHGPSPDTDLSWFLYPAPGEKLRPDAPSGSCRTTPVSGFCVCLHHVEVLPDLRGHGLGTRMLQLLSARLWADGITRVILHVSGDNLPAIALYKKTGFRIIETLSYYLYSRGQRAK